MKLLYYCSKFPPQAGGAGIDAYQLGIDLSHEGHQVFVVCEYAAGLKKFEKHNENYSVYRVSIPGLNRGSGIYFILLCLAIAWKGIRIAWHEKPDVLHCHDTATGISGLLTKWITRLPVVFKFGGSMTYEYLCNDKPAGFDPVKGENAAWLHPVGIGKWLLKIEKQFFKQFDRIYPIAQYLVDMLHQHIQLGTEKIHLIHNGVDVDKIQPQNFLPAVLPPGVKRYVFTGIRFVKYKGVHVLINACLPILAELDAHLIIAGSGPEEDMLHEIAAGNPRVIFTGNLSWQENMSFVRSASVYVLPSFVDKTPSSLMEALALEAPCIASDIDGVKELIGPGGGILVTPNQPEMLSEKIRYLIEHPAEAAEMGRGGRKYIVENFRWELTREKIQQLYFQLRDK